MTHAERLCADVLDYVKTNHPMHLHALEAQAEDLTTVINTLLVVDPPGATMTEVYRCNFLEAFGREFNRSLYLR